VSHAFGIAAVTFAVAGVILLRLGWKNAPEGTILKNEWDELNQFRQEYSSLFGLACLVAAAALATLQFLMP
jgi:hypothetical protein